MALANNPAVTGALARLEVARGRFDQAGLRPNPVIGYHATEIAIEGTAGQQGAFVSQQFVTAGKLQLDQAMADQEVEAAHFQWHAQEQRVLGDVRTRFYDALVSQRRYELTAELARLSDDLAKATEKLLDQRLGTENDVLQAQIMMDESHILHDNARNENIETWRRLATVVGIPNLPMTRLAGGLEADLTRYDWEQCQAMVLHCHPELVEARTQVELARLAIIRAKREPIPNVDVMLSVRHHNVVSDDVANVQAGVPIPVFNRNQGNVRAAEAEWMVARNEVQHIQLDLLDRLAVAYRRHANAGRQVDRYANRMIPRAKRSLQLVTSGYELGQVGYLTLLNAQQTYLQVNLSYLDSLRELRASTVLIESQLLSGSLATRPSSAK
jgi:cobalt-zinc-cadmium efflux system outer membrane protein